MKKLFLILITVFTIIEIKAQPAVKKSSAPEFTVTKVEILCCGNSLRNTTKKIHIISDAGWSTFTDVGAVVKDALGNTIASYPTINGDFFSPCINLADGQTYTVNIVNGVGALMRLNNGTSCTYNIKAPDCGKTEYGGSSGRLDSIKAGNWSEVLPTNCVPQKSLNISTGLNAAGTLIATNAADPFWGGFAIANLTGAYTPWNVIAGTRILSPTTSNSVNGTQTFKRNFYLCTATTVTFSGIYRADNKLVTIKLKDAANVQKWLLTPPPATIQAYNDYPFSGSVNLPAGNYYFEFTYTSNDLYAGFALSGTITASTPVLSNYPNCCQVCECGKWEGFRFEFADRKTERKEELMADKRPRVIGCLQTLIVRKGTPVKLSPLFTCNQECAATYKAYLFLPGGGTQEVTGFPYLFIQTTPGYYTLKVVPYCGDKACEPCLIRIFVTPGCEGEVLPTDAKDVEFINTVLAGEGRG